MTERLHKIATHLGFQKDRELSTEHHLNYYIRTHFNKQKYAPEVLLIYPNGEIFYDSGIQCTQSITYTAAYTAHPSFPKTFAQKLSKNPYL